MTAQSGLGFSGIAAIQIPDDGAAGEVLTKLTPDDYDYDWNPVAGGFAPNDAEYVVLALNATLTDERVLTPGVGLALVDGGAGGLVTLNVDLTLQEAYDNLTTVPQITINATPDPLTIDASVAGLIFEVRDVSNISLLSIGTVGGSITGGSNVGDILTLRGSTDSTLGLINIESPIDFFNVEPGGNPVVNIRIRDDYTTGTGVVVQATIQSTRELSVATSIWFNSQIQDSGVYIQTVTPGFSAFLLFNAFPTISTGGPTAATSLIASVCVQSAIVHENDGDGAGIGAFANIGLQYRAAIRALTAGDTIFITDSTGLLVLPDLSAQDVASTVTLTTVRGVWLREPLTNLHIGTGVIEAYIGLDMDDISFGTGFKVAVRSALSAAASTFFLQHTGTAQSLLGGDLEIDGDLNHDGTNIGFYGTAPVAQSAAYTRNAAIVEDRTLLASASATTTNNNNVLAALIADLQAPGILG